MQLVIPGGVNILQFLRSKGVFIPAYCGGSGVCGKCLVRLMAGTLPVTQEDRFLLSSDKLAQGFRLACKAVTSTPVRIELPEQTLSYQKSENDNSDIDPSHSFGIAVDIGTTTIAASLVDITGKTAVRTLTTANSQAAYGADVITRLSAAQESSAQLQELIRRDISALLSRLCLKDLLVTKMAVAANTAMYHLLLGLDCRGLTKAPFYTVTLGGQTMLLSSLLGDSFDEAFPDISVSLIPGISAFIGGDIVSGIASVNADEPFLFADIGTNGEIVLADKDNILCASAAAGPAFEGGELSCGMGGINGAVSRIYDDGGAIKYDIIGTPPAKGLCGSGAADALAFCVRHGIIDRTGAFDEIHRESGFVITDGVTLTQDDVRQLQLAKSAIRSCMEVLLKTAGKGYEDIKTLIIAGGFGYFLDLESAAVTGLIPGELLKYAKALGNTSLRGAQMSLYDEGFDKRVSSIIKRAKTLTLTDSEEFKKDFINNLNI